MLLSKPQIDVGLFTENLAPMKTFWQDTVELTFSAQAEIPDVLTQYRFEAGNSILKINTSAHGPHDQQANGYQEVFVARPGIDQPVTQPDPDGNRVTLVPEDWEGIGDLGVRLAVRDLGAHRAFMTDVLQCDDLGEGRFRSGAGLFMIEEDRTADRAGHWIGAGLTYTTIHVTDVDQEFAGLVARGAEVGEAPFTIGDIARICFIRDPDGNWVEVAQRFSLAGAGRTS